MGAVDAWTRRQDGRWLFPAAFLLSAGFFRVFLSGIGVNHEPLYYWSASLVLALCIVCPVLPQSRRRFRQMDWRIGAMLLATLFAVGLTLIGFDEGWQTEATEGRFIHDVFAGWTASVVFFALVGLLVAGVPIARPEHSGFNARARILFRGEDGPHIDFIIAALSSTLAHYAQLIEMTIVVRDHHAASDRFLTFTEIKTTLKSWLDDVPTRYQDKIELLGATDPPTGGTPNRLTHLIIGGQPRGDQPFINRDLVAAIDAVIPPFETCFVESGYEVWVQAGTEPYAYEAVRFTRQYRLNVCNRTPGGKALRLRLSRDSGSTFVPRQLANGETQTIFEELELKPGIELYDLRLDSLVP